MFNTLIDFLRKEGNLSFWRNIIWISMLTGASSAGLITLVNQAGESASNSEINFQLFAIYIVMFLLYYITKQYAISKASEEIESLIHITKERISHKIISSELLEMERLNPSTLLTRLSRDTSVISQASFQITSASQSSIMVVFSLLYIFSISAMVFFTLIITVALVVYSYLLYVQRYNRQLGQLNMIEEKSLHSFTSILNGFKEIKINSKKSRKLMDDHDKNLNNLLELKLENSKATTGLILYADIFLYSLLGLIVFIVPHLSSLDDTTITKLTAITLFIIGPFSMIVTTIPMVSKTDVAIKSLNDLENYLDQSPKNVELIKEEEETLQNFKTLSIQNINFHYSNHNNEPIFTVGPLNLTIQRGETIFIVGGNGSGKSTLIKVLLGLYFPNNGEIVVDDETILEYNYQSYRNLFSIILTDFHLFKRLYGIENINKKAINQLLVEMQLHKKTKFIDGSFTNTDLSTGQRKRLALIVAILENKPIYVFDEWAADQDPEFRKYFYEVILKRLKEEGKTIIAVTHDDAYFHLADHVYKMNYGQLSPYQHP